MAVIFVFAGSYREFISRFPSHQREYRYISSTDTLRGIRGGRFIKIGAWYRRPDMDHILHELVYSGMTEVHYIPPPILREEFVNTEFYQGGHWDEVQEPPETDDDKYFYRIGYKP